VAVTLITAGPNAGQAYSSLTGTTYASAADAHAAEDALNGPVDVTGNAAQAAQNDENVSYGTGYTPTFTPMSEEQKLDNHLTGGNVATAPMNPNSTNPLDVADQVIGKYAPQTPAAPVATRGTVQGATAPFNASPLGAPPASAQRIAPGSIDATGIDASTLQKAGVIPGSTPQSGAPTADTSKVDNTVAGVNNTISQLLGLANQPEYSAAEQQLLDSDRRNQLAAQQALGQNQSAALGAARSGNRRDQALLQRQAIGESNYLGTQAQQQQVQNQIALEGNLATARATEETNYNKDRASMLQQAASLGLNVAALQTDLSKADLSAASDYLNQQFNQLGIDKQLSEDQTKNILSFTQAMAAIQEQYDSMSNSDQQHTLDLMMQQYGIDKQSETALEQIKEQRKVNWGQVLTGLAGGVGQGVTLGVGKLVAGAL
jgi:hypothetical protein